MNNILFIVPHPDDEIVGASIIINRLLKKKKLFFFFLTNGVISKNQQWFWDRNGYENKVKRRNKEMKSSISNLGFKKFYLQNISTRSLKLNIEKTYNKILKIGKSHKIDTIFCPAYEGGHQDHDVANFICSRLNGYFSIYEFAEYNFFQKKINSNKFIKPAKKDIIIELTNEEKKIKRKMLNIYLSESNNLNYISLKQESYRKLINYDYMKPPHQGTLFYRRFSFFDWHPRVDSDSPELICKCIAESKIF